MLKILIDARLIEKPRGLGRYVRELLFAIGSSHAVAFEIFVLTPNGSESCVAELGEFKVVSSPRFPVPIWEQFVVPWWAWKLRVNLVHSPCNTTALLLARFGVRTVVTIHDLMFFDVQGANLYQKAGNAYRRIVVSRYPRKHLSIVAVSEATRACILAKLGVNASVIQEPVSKFLGNRGGVGLGARRVGEGPYFIHIGGIAAHKNTQLVINAFNAAALPGFRLVILGVPHTAKMALKWRASNVEIPGWLSDDEVATRIAGALGMIFPSLAEGYGLPILEAFSLGCPVITSAVAPMDELAGGAALLVDPRSPAKVAEAIRRIAADESLRAELIDRGRVRANEFSAERIGAEVLGAYLRAAGGTPIE